MTKTKLLLAILFAFLRPGVDDPADPPPADDPPAGDPPADDFTVNTDDPPADPPAPKAETAEQLRARADAAEAESRRNREELETVRRGTAAPDDETRQRAEEDRILADPKSDPNRRWQIEANRTLRTTQRAAAQANFNAADTADRTRFERLEVTHPAIYKRYSARVEEELRASRAKGTNAPREAILRYLIGNDALDGKLKPRANPAPPVDRGSEQPRARSDVRANGKMTEHQRRANRLKDIQI